MRCPYCGVDRPNLSLQHRLETHDHAGASKRYWATYNCSRCGGVVIAASRFSQQGLVTESYPAVDEVSEAIPDRARHYLTQALDSLHAPAGAIMLAASSVDAMLKAKGYSDGSLYARIDKAAADHLITSDMARWAHEVRLDANDQRHADQNAELPTTEDARRGVDFAIALAEIMFVLPARVQRGLSEGP